MRCVMQGSEYVDQRRRIFTGPVSDYASTREFGSVVRQSVRATGRCSSGIRGEFRGMPRGTGLAPEEAHEHAATVLPDPSAHASGSSDAPSGGAGRIAGAGDPRTRASGLNLATGLRVGGP